MIKEDNKTIVRQLVAEVYNTGNIELAEKYFDAACVLHHPALPQPGRGIETVKGFIAGVRSAFPDFHVEIEDLIAEGDKVVDRATISGTFEGAFGAIPPTGQHATWTATAICRIAGGKIVEVWEDVDMLGMSSLAGAHNYLFTRVMELLKEKGADDIVVVGGGIFPEEDIPKLKVAGVKAIFTPGSKLKDIVAWVKENVKTRD